MRLLIVGLLLCVAREAAGWEDRDREWGLVYKTCGADGEVEEEEVEESVTSMVIVRNGYYRGNSHSVEMMGQCEADLDACECLQCFTHALHHCPASLSAQIRLHRCFLSYSYHPNSFPPGPLHNTNTNTNRIAAIVVAAGVALLLALLFLSFLASRYSKRHYYY